MTKEIEELYERVANLRIIKERTKIPEQKERFDREIKETRKKINFLQSQSQKRDIKERAATNSQPRLSPNKKARFLTRANNRARGIQNKRSFARPRKDYGKIARRLILNSGKDELKEAKKNYQLENLRLRTYEARQKQLQNVKQRHPDALTPSEVLLSKRLQELQDAERRTRIAQTSPDRRRIFREKIREQLARNQKVTNLMNAPSMFKNSNFDILQTEGSILTAPNVFAQGDNIMRTNRPNVLQTSTANKTQLIFGRNNSRNNSRKIPKSKSKKREIGVGW